jgi:hypothetical protein
MDCDRHTLSGYRLVAVRLPRPQRQLVVPRGKSGRDHDELPQLICDRSIMGLAVAQQFYSGAWRSHASDDRVTRSPNECNVEDRHDLIAAVRRGGRNGKCGCHRESVGSCISNARSRWRNRCCCGSGFNWRLPFARETRDKCRTTLKPIASAASRMSPADAVIEMWRPNTDAWALRGHLDSVAATIIDGETASRLRQERLAGSRLREERSQRPVAGPRSSSGRFWRGR